MSTLTLAAVQSRPTPPVNLVDALDLRPGMRVEDNFTAWAEVVTVERRPCLDPDCTHGIRARCYGVSGVRVTWLLADGTRDTETHPTTDCFNRLTPEPRCGRP